MLNPMTPVAIARDDAQAVHLCAGVTDGWFENKYRLTVAQVESMTDAEIDEYLRRTGRA